MEGTQQMRLRSTKGIKDYKVDVNMSSSERVAHFLNWAAEETPGRAFNYQQLAQIAFAMPRLPKEGANEVSILQRNRMGQVKRILMDNYKRDIAYIPGTGIRATTASESIAGNSFVKKTRRL